jgi:hypothetical protein
MTSPTALLQRAAELVIAFGLDDADTTAEQICDMVANGNGFMVLWRKTHQQDIELAVFRRTDGLKLRIYNSANELTPSEARVAHAFHGRVIDLAERIEALR